MNPNSENNKTPFSVPEGYFDSLPDKVLRQINEMPEQEVKTPVRIIFRRQLAIAAAFIGFFLVSSTVVLLLSKSKENKKQEIAQTLSYDDVVLQRVSEVDLMDAMVDEDQPLNEKQVEDYLINDDIHESVLSDYINQ